ncbi:MAG TPA: hypothetical protein VN448_08105 [Gammaproteobacteria bacterium]|nr:hypothetical protein [Gammaproteobacteria bacterium]
MAISHRYHTDRAKLALELTMRDALAGMEELASLEGYWSDTHCLEILSIEPSRPVECSTAETRSSAAILIFPEQRRRTG